MAGVLYVEMIFFFFFFNLTRLLCRSYRGTKTSGSSLLFASFLGLSQKDGLAKRMGKNLSLMGS